MGLIKQRLLSVGGQNIEMSDINRFKEDYDNEKVKEYMNSKNATPGQIGYIKMLLYKLGRFEELKRIKFNSYSMLEAKKKIEELKRK